jgi:Protein of unknown function (DUF1566)
MSISGRIIVVVLVIVSAQTAWAATPAAKCEAAKLKIAAKYSLCRLKVQAKGVKIGPGAETSGDLAKCDATFTDKWAKAESKGGSSCPTSGDAGRVRSVITDLTMLAGVTLAGPEFVDNGDGTISDIYTGLMWEKKTPGECVFTPSPGFPIACTTDNDCVNNGGGGACTCGGSDPHCVRATYTWSTGSDMPDGTAFTEFLGQLNNCVSDGTTVTGGFAGHCDWRLPSQAELISIFDRSQPGCPAAVPCTDPIFLPVGVSPLHYWSSTSFNLDPSQAYAWGFDYTSFGGPKTTLNFVRAVRSGS